MLINILSASLSLSVSSLPFKNKDHSPTYTLLLSDLVTFPLVHVKGRRMLVNLSQLYFSCKTIFCLLACYSAGALSQYSTCTYLRFNLFIVCLLDFKCSVIFVSLAFFFLRLVVIFFCVAHISFPCLYFQTLLLI